MRVDEGDRNVAESTPDLQLASSAPRLVWLPPSLGLGGVADQDWL